MAAQGSAAYRQSSRPRADAEEIDQANQLLWRMNPRRLDAEGYRDSLLQAAGLLNLEMYEPSLDWTLWTIPGARCMERSTEDA